MFRRLFLYGAGYLGGQPKAGVELAPNYFRKYGLKKIFEKKLGYYVEDGGNIKINKNKETNNTYIMDDIGYYNNIIYDTLIPHLNNNTQCLTLGGDHSIAIGSVSATLKAHPDAVVIWVDAHADINTKDTSSSGNLHGMPLGYLLGLESSKIDFGWMNTSLRGDSLIYFGLRDIDPPEWDHIKKLDISYQTKLDMDRKGIIQSVTEALSHIDSKRPIHLSFDIDVLDPSIAPATGTKVENGLTMEEALILIRTIKSDGRKIVNMDLVEVNPKLFENVSNQKDNRVELTLNSGISIIEEVFKK